MISIEKVIIAPDHDGYYRSCIWYKDQKYILGKCHWNDFTVILIEFITLDLPAILGSDTEVVLSAKQGILPPKNCPSHSLYTWISGVSYKTD